MTGGQERAQAFCMFFKVRRANEQNADIRLFQSGHAAESDAIGFAGRKIERGDKELKLFRSLEELPCGHGIGEGKIRSARRPHVRRPRPPRLAAQSWPDRARHCSTWQRRRAGASGSGWAGHKGPEGAMTMKKPLYSTVLAIVLGVIISALGAAVVLLTRTLL
jgi:hypothetical protein